MILEIVNSGTSIEALLGKVINGSMELGLTLGKAALIYAVGSIAIKIINKLVRKLMEKRKIDPSIKTFVGSLTKVTLTILLLISVIHTLGVETTTFAALLASAGLAVGMALSGNLANFAGGLIVLLFKPYVIGNVIEAPGLGIIGTVKEIQIFHTIITTADNKMIYVPNGSLSSGVVTNYSHQDTRRVEWVFGVDYGEDFERVKQTIEKVLLRDVRILSDPVPMIALHALAASSVNIVVRVWVKNTDFWNVYFDINQIIYETFNKEGINFPFPQLTVHKA